MATDCHDVFALLSTTRVYTPACGRTCDMGRPERRERERKAAARTCHSINAFFHPKREVTGPTPNHLLLYHHTPDLHLGSAKSGDGLVASVFLPESPFFNTSYYYYIISPTVSPRLY